MTAPRVQAHLPRYKTATVNPVDDVLLPYIRYDDARSRVVRLLVRTRGRYALRSAANSGDPSVHQYRERARTTDIAPSAHGVRVPSHRLSPKLHTSCNSPEDCMPGQHSALALSDPLGNSVPAHRYRSNASRRESLTIWNDHVRLDGGSISRRAPRR